LSSVCRPVCLYDVGSNPGETIQGGGQGRSRQTHHLPQLAPKQMMTSTFVSPLDILFSPWFECSSRGEFFNYPLEIKPQVYSSGSRTPFVRLYTRTNIVQPPQVFLPKVDLRSSPTIFLKNQPQVVCICEQSVPDLTQGKK